VLAIAAAICLGVPNMPTRKSDDALSADGSSVTGGLRFTALPANADGFVGYETVLPVDPAVRKSIVVFSSFCY
jgi:hypothetical protein